VDDFKLAAAKPMIARMIFDKVDDHLTFPLKRMGLVTLFSVIDIEQTRDYIKLLVETYLERVCEKHMNGWMTLPQTQGQLTTPLPNRKEFIQGFLAAVGDEDPEEQQALDDEMGLGYRSGVGELIFAMVAA